MVNLGGIGVKGFAEFSVSCPEFVFWSFAIFKKWNVLNFGVFFEFL